MLRPSLSDRGVQLVQETKLGRAKTKAGRKGSSTAGDLA